MEVHNYIPASNYKGKLKNWKLLNSKVLPKFGYYVPALCAMDPDRDPHPNCGIALGEIEFMTNIINGICHKKIKTKTLQASGNFKIRSKKEMQIGFFPKKRLK